MSETYFNLNYIVKNVIESSNVNDYLRKLGKRNNNIINENGIYKILEKDLIQLLENSKNDKSKQFIELIKTNKANEALYKPKNDILKDNFVDVGKKQFYFCGKSVSYIKTPKGDIYFKAKDIALILDYSNTNQAIIDNVSETQKFKLNDIIKNPSPEGVARNDPLSDNESQQNIQFNTIYINEAGLYSLIFGSKKEEAIKFRNWVTSEVLPQIRKTGRYSHSTNFDYSDYFGKSCFYLFLIKGNIFKFGITSDLKDRLDRHRLDNNLLCLEDQLLKIITFNNINEASKIENIIKKFIKDTNIKSDHKNGTEYFVGQDNAETIIKMVEEYKQTLEMSKLETYQQTNIDKSIQLLLLQNQQLDKQIEMKKIVYDVEVIKNNQTSMQLKLNELEKQLNNIDTTKIVINNMNIDNSKNSYVKPIPDLPNIKKPKNKCVDCNCEIYKTSTRCGKCQAKIKISEFAKKSNRPSLEQINKDLKELKTFKAVGKKYGVSDNCIRKWIKNLKKIEV
jgi:prophage antirepressor-like protein